MDIALEIIYNALVGYVEDSAGADSQEASDIQKAYSVVRDGRRDLAATTAYIYSEFLMDKGFFTAIDRATDLAEKFIQKYPTGTNWEKQPKDWETTIYNFVKKENE